MLHQMFKPRIHMATGRDNLLQPRSRRIRGWTKQRTMPLRHGSGVFHHLRLGRHLASQDRLDLHLVERTFQGSWQDFGETFLYVDVVILF